MKNVKITIILFLISIPIFTFLGYLDYKTTSVGQIFSTTDGQLFLLFYGVLFTLFGWLMIGSARIVKRVVRK